MHTPELIPHLFRTEYRKITAVLCKRLGIQEIALAEDIASDTFLQAVETWSYRGLPAQPKAWLYTVAKNKAKNHFQRLATFEAKVVPAVQETDRFTAFPDIDLSEQNIQDSQLQMLFALCHPAIPIEAQVGLSLRILCGFGIDEIAAAFLGTREMIAKRLQRAKEKLRQVNAPIEFPGEAALQARLQTVLKTLYLLFSEGYYSECQDQVLRKDLCLEAMRLTHLLLQHPAAAQPDVHALLALMCFHASRFGAREDALGELILYDDQDEGRWNLELVQQGSYHLHLASQGGQLSSYHIEASIAYWHTQKADTTAKWGSILELYDHLLRLQHSPVAALNRLYALSKVQGNAVAIAEAERLGLDQNPYWHALMANLHRATDLGVARRHLLAALGLAKSKGDRQVIALRLAEMESG